MARVVYQYEKSDKESHVCRSSMDLDINWWGWSSSYPAGSVIECDCGKLYYSVPINNINSWTKIKRLYPWHKIARKMDRQVQA